MTAKTYKAFISYSHHDEAWAKWLHKALESYRVPRRLRIGLDSEKLYPVFRDRDELSSASDLSGKVQDALNDSESLVVVCSPASAKSRWVNEEIRLFRSLGLEDRIFCVIVDGDPLAANLDEACFPPALLEGSVGETHEPLAADARKWADGRTLAKLKLIAGIMDIRLDELRRREQQRKRKSQLVYIAMIVAAIALVAITISSRVEEKARRAHSEQLISQIVDISEDLNTVVDLETLRKIGERLRGYLDTIDPGDLTAESNRQIALVLRQLGEVSRLQGKPDEALSALNESREIFRYLRTQAPGDNKYLYELGNAEFYVGNALMMQGDHDQAGAAFQDYYSAAQELVRREPDNPDWMMELSFANTNLAGFQNLSGEGSASVALAHGASAIELIESAMAIAPDKDSYRVHYATALAWMADTHMRACNLGSALESRLKNLDLIRRALSSKAGDNNLKKQYAYALTGVAGLQRLVGLTQQALQNLETARGILHDLTEFDSENLGYRWEMLRRDALIYSLEGESGDLDGAVQGASELLAPMRTALDREDLAQATRYSQYAQYLLDFSTLNWLGNRPVPALQALEQAIDQLSAILSVNETDQASLIRLAMARFLWWEQSGADLLETRPELRALSDPGNGENESCIGADLAARHAIIAGDRKSAQEGVNYLRARGYFEPGFNRFCRSYGLCDE